MLFVSYNVNNNNNKNDNNDVSNVNNKNNCINNLRNVDIFINVLNDALESSNSVSRYFELTEETLLNYGNDIIRLCENDNENDKNKIYELIDIYTSICYNNGISYMTDTNLQINDINEIICKYSNHNWYKEMCKEKIRIDAEEYVNNANNSIDIDMFIVELNNIITQHTEISEQQLSDHSKNLMCLCVNVDDIDNEDKISNLIDMYGEIFNNFNNSNNSNIPNTFYYIYSASDIDKKFKFKFKMDILHNPIHFEFKSGFGSGAMKLVAYGPQDYYLTNTQPSQTHCNCAIS